MGEVCKHIVMHYNDGWNDGYHYNIAYWEIWNEPDLEDSERGSQMTITGYTIPSYKSSKIMILHSG